MGLKHLINGAATYLPIVNKLRAKGTGGTTSARYCYSVWLRHLVMAKINRLDPHPKVIAELGPGDSLGIGLAALISGCDKYYAFDIVEHADTKRNMAIFDELVELFKNKTPIPAEDEFPKVKPYLNDYSFPSNILNDERLRHALNANRISSIRNSLINPIKNNPIIQYKVPWYDTLVIEEESVDMIYSQAVLEHVDDLQNTYRSMYSWIKPTGYISHQIDFKCHGNANEWNGHWTYSDLTWKIIRGKRPYLINRLPHSAHIAMLKEAGFNIVCDKTVESESHLNQARLALRFRSITDKDLITSGAFIQGTRVSAC